MRATACWSPCGGPTRSRTIAAWSIASASEIPHASIGSDVIVGFPGETDDDFQEFEAYLASSPLTHVHVFPYSDRPGTAAAALGDKVHGSIVRERAHVLRESSRELNRTFHRAQSGTVRLGLTIDDGSVVVTDNYLKVRIPSGLPRNEWVTVAMTRAATRWSARSSNRRNRRTLNLESNPVYNNAAAFCAGDLFVPSTIN